MADENDQAREGREKFIRFLKIFEGIETAAIRSAEAALVAAETSKRQIAATEKLIEVVNKSIAVNTDLFNAIVTPHDGVTAAIDDLIMEVQGLRNDLRTAMKANGITAIFGPLLGGPQGKRKR